MGRVGVSQCRQLERDQEAEGPAGPLCEPGLGSSWPGPLLLPLCLGCRERRGSLAAWGGVSAWSSQVVQCELPDTEYRTRVLRPVVLVMAFLHWSASGVPAAH